MIKIEKNSVTAADFLRRTWVRPEFGRDRQTENQRKTMKTQFTLMTAAATVAMAVACSLSAATLYVSLESTDPTPPYTNWATAAHVIQDAVDAAATGDEVVVTNGVYTTGGRDGSRVMITNSIRLASVNGPQFTVIDAGGAQCVSLAEGASLSGFVVTNGVGQGGGISCASTSAFITNCVIVGNSALCAGGGVSGGTVHNCVLTGNSAYWGGGAFGSILYNCTLKDNQGTWSGGADSCTLYNCVLTGNCGGGGAAAGWSTLYNCVLSGNSDGGAAGLLSSRTIWSKWADRDCGGVQPKCGTTVPPPGGVVLSSTLYNCTLTGNAGGLDGTFYNCTIVDNQGNVSGAAFNSVLYYNAGGNYAEGTTLHYCCTSPLPTNGVGNITGPPLVMDLAAGDFRLREDSPCIDAGANLALLNAGYSYEPTDILGNTRFIDGNGDGLVAWDIGAYEFSSYKPPRVSLLPHPTPEGWSLTVTGAPNRRVRLETSTNLKDWSIYWSWSMGPEGVQQVNDSDMERKVMFYRAVVP